MNTKDLDEIPASADTVMTDELIRLFAYAGCSPTMCHTCSDIIGVGQIFKLQPHHGTDEMLCAKCGIEDLIKRDSRIIKTEKKAAPIRQQKGDWGGFSRPSKPEVKDPSNEDRN